MMTAGFFLRVCLSALMIVVASGHPVKGSKSTQQSSSGSSGPSGGFAYRGGASSRFTPVTYGTSGGVSMPVLVQNPTPSQFVVVQADPALSSLSSTGPVGYTVPSGSVVSVPAVPSGSVVSVPAVPSGSVVSVPAVPSGSVVSVPAVPSGSVVSVPAVPSGSVVSVPAVPSGSVVSVPAVPSGSVVSVPAVPSGSVVSVPAVPSGSVVSVPAVPSGMVLPVQGGNVVYSSVGYAGSPQAGAAQPGLQETSWAVDPRLVPAEEGSFDSQASGSGDLLYPAPQLPSGPVLQSGETSSVVKEAELGNYQQQREEFGYPADPLLSGQGLGNLVVPASVPGGYWGYPYPDFDYRLLYRMYPPGTYNTFSQHNEKGKDYYQSIHYLKEHEDGGQGQVQQKKVFQGAF